MNLILSTKVQKRVAILLLLTVFCGITPKPVGAQEVVTDPKNTLVNTISQAAVAAGQFLLEQINIKEGVLDGIAWAIAKTALQRASKSIVRWINSGFEGSPSFIQDPQAFFLDVADRVAGDFIYNDTALDFLCSPIQFNVRVALATQQFSDFEPVCRLSDVVANVEGFYEGNFQAGGWPAWFQAVNSSTDLPAGALVAANAEMTLRIQRKTGVEEHKLDWGKGFFSWEECYEEEGDEYCETLTPGSVIAEKINFTLTGGARTLIAADEINEIISAFFAQLGKEAITGLGGLFGTSRSVGGRPSYFDQAEEDEASTANTLNTTEDLIARDTELNKNYANLQLKTISVINDQEIFIVDTYEAASSCPGIPETLSQTLQNQRANAEKELRTSQETEEVIRDIQLRYNGTAADQERFDIISEYQTLRKSGNLPTDGDVIKGEFDVEKLQESFQSERVLINARIDQCFNSGI